MLEGEKIGKKVENFYNLREILIFRFKWFSKFKLVFRKKEGFDLEIL